MQKFVDTLSSLPNISKIECKGNENDNIELKAQNGKINIILESDDEDKNDDKKTLENGDKELNDLIQNIIDLKIN